MSEEQTYDDYYPSIDVCPYCNHHKIVKIYNGSDGLFSYKTFSHYKCSKCSREFTSPAWLRVVPKDEVKRIAQAGILSNITVDELIEQFKKIGIHLYEQPWKKKENLEKRKSRKK